MRKMFFLFLMLLFNTIAIAQCNKKLVKWIHQIRTEYPGENLDRVGGKEIQKIVYNLYSDKYFIPVFKEPFDQVSNKYLKLIEHQGTGAKCVRTIPGNWGELTDPVRDALGERIQRRNEKQYSYEIVKAKVIELRRIRKECKQMVSELQNQNARITYKKFQNWIDKIESRYVDILMGSEIAYLKTLIASNKERIADQNFKAKVAEILPLRNDYSALGRIINLKSGNNSLYNRLSTDYKKTVDQQIQIKTIKILDVLIKQDLASSTLLTMNIAELNDFRKTFNDKYDGFENQSQIKKVNEQISNKKTNLLIKNLSAIQIKVKSTPSIDQLNELEKMYFSGVDKKGVLELENLSKNIKDQEGKIHRNIRNQEIARQEEKVRLIEQGKKEIQSLRV